MPEERQIGKRKKITFVLFCIVTICITLTFIAIANSRNEIRIEPQHQFIHGGDSFDVAIICNPMEPIKSWEFTISYDPTLIIANSVTEGNFFSGYPTFFSPNVTIDNVNGTITKLYDLIVGQGNVTGPGTLITINFTSIALSGVSLIQISDAGVTNETEYLNLSTYGGEIQLYGDYYPWDINHDGRTDYIDASIIVLHFSENVDPPGSQPWDVVADGVIDYRDVSALVRHFGE